MHPVGHGYYQLHSEQGFLLAQLYDSWNVTTTEQYRTDIQQEMSQYEGRPWAAVFDIRHWQFLTPESLPIMQQQISWCLQNRLSHCIYLAPDSGILDYLKQQAHAEVPTNNCKFVQLSSIEQCLLQFKKWQVKVPANLISQLRIG